VSPQRAQATVYWAHEKSQCVCRPVGFTASARAVPPEELENMGPPNVHLAHDVVSNLCGSSRKRRRGDVVARTRLR